MGTLWGILTIILVVKFYFDFKFRRYCRLEFKHLNTAIDERLERSSETMRGMSKNSEKLLDGLLKFKKMVSPITEDMKTIRREVEEIDERLRNASEGVKGEDNA